MNVAEIAARNASAAKYAIATAKPRRRTPWRWSQSTPGLRASARKSAIRIHVITCRAIQITSRATATLPDGRDVLIRVSVPDDPYIPRRELDTVDVELFANGQVLAAVNTVLDADQVSEARQLAREIVA